MNASQSTDLSTRVTEVAARIGREHGESAATWFEIADVDAARRIVAGLTDGDPEILDSLPAADLSGQWADGYTPRQLLNEIAVELDVWSVGQEMTDLWDDACSAYEFAFDDAVHSAVEASALAMLPTMVDVATEAGLRPLVFTGETLTGAGWVPMDVPVGGERASMGDFSAADHNRPGVAPTHFEVPVTLWGDYVGSGVERSNHRSLLRDYPETFVDVYGDYSSHYLVIPVANLTQELVDTFTGLRYEYPLYDESDHSELEMELADEAWDAYVKWDLPRALREAGVSDEVLDEISDEDLRERFYTAVSDTPQPYYCESADSVVFPYWDDVVAALVEHYGAETPEFCSLCQNAGHLTLDHPATYVRRFDGLGDVWEVRWHGGSTFNIYFNGDEVDVFTRYGDDKGNAPSLDQARQFVEDWAAGYGREVIGGAR